MRWTQILIVGIAGFGFGWLGQEAWRAHWVDLTRSSASQADAPALPVLPADLVASERTIYIDPTTSLSGAEMRKGLSISLDLKGWPDGSSRNEFLLPAARSLVPGDGGGGSAFAADLDAAMAEAGWAALDAESATTPTGRVALYEKADFYIGAVLTRNQRGERGDGAYHSVEFFTNHPDVPSGCVADCSWNHPDMVILKSSAE